MKLRSALYTSDKHPIPKSRNRDSMILSSYVLPLSITARNAPSLHTWLQNLPAAKKGEKKKSKTKGMLDYDIWKKCKEHYKERSLLCYLLCIKGSHPRTSNLLFGFSSRICTCSMERVLDKHVDSNGKCYKHQSH